MLPLLDEDATLSADTAKQDKIDLELGEWTVRGNDGDANMLFLSLSQKTVRLDNSPIRLKWFNAPQGWRFSTQTINFRGAGHGGRTTVGVPLVSGSLNIKRNGSRSDHGPTHFSVKATLSINPTRFVRHRGSTFRTNANPSEWSDRDDRTLLLSRRLPRNMRDEYILDENDNVLLSQRSQYAARADVWRYQVACYWQNIQRLLEELITTNPPLGAIIRRQSTELNLRRVETYWEFASDDALHTVAMLVPAMQAMGMEFTSRLYPHGEIEECVYGNALSIKARLTTSVTCTLYAKTSKRVRLEIQHDLQEDADVIGGRQTSNNPDILHEWLHMIAEDAARRGGEVLRALQLEITNTASQRSVYDFLSRIIEIVEDENTYDRIVSQLVNTARIHLRNHDPLRPIVERLERAKILFRPRKYQQQSTIHPQYRTAIAELRGSSLRRHRAPRQR